MKKKVKKKVIGIIVILALNAGYILFIRWFYPEYWSAILAYSIFGVVVAGIITYVIWKRNK